MRELIFYEDEIYYRLGAAIILTAIKDFKHICQQVRRGIVDDLFELKRIVRFYKSKYCQDLTRLSTRIFLEDAKKELENLERYYRYYPPSDKLAKRVLPQIEDILRSYYGKV